jgi:acetylornithine deacetylase/succinyl-diaminopimelate desuccinylase-like protein
MDMKGPLAACVHGVAAAAEQLPSGRVVVTATVAEELVEGPALVAVAESVRPDLVVICEATGLGLAVGQRGRAEIVVEVEGRPTHSSRPELGVNAAEAMADGGLLHIQTYVHGAQAGQRSVVVAVTDTGAGIPADQLPYIFDGLHTTKERGMGLGLYTSKAIIDRHMGRINAESMPGEGTTFTIMLPIGAEENAI